MRLASGQGPEAACPSSWCRRCSRPGTSVRRSTAVAGRGRGAPWIQAREQWPLIAPFVRLLLDELPAAVDGISRVVELLRAFGAVDLLPTPLLMLSRVRILTGNPMEARTCLEEAMTLVESIGGQLAVGEYFESERDLLLTEISALVGDRTACLAHAAATLRRRGGGNDNIARCRARRALGVLAEEAVTPLRRGASCAFSTKKYAS